MTLSNLQLHFTPYLYEQESAPRSSVFTAGKVYTYGVPDAALQGLQEAFGGMEPLTLDPLLAGVSVEKLTPPKKPVRRIRQPS